MFGALFMLMTVSGAQDALPVFSHADIPAWREHIRPAAEDVAFEQIPWLASFEQGVRASDAQAKPLLMWVMNGHPLGCT
jgi:hypothetical protein